jgi:drug/metabolite transporter (DMT)-like permease
VTPPPPRPLLGIALMLAGMLVLPLQDGVAKWLSETQSVPMVVWARYVFHLALLVPLLLWRLSPAEIVLRRPGTQVVRAVVMLASSLLFFGALARLPLVDTLALFFVSPLVVALLAPWLLRERVGLARLLAVAVGFVGVLIVLRPGSAVWGPYALLALGSGVMHALYLIVTRRLAGSAAPLTTLAFGAAFGAAALSVWVIPRWVPPTPQEWGLMIALGVLATVGHYLVVKAFDFAPASTLSPLGYAEIVGATLVGYLFFADLPDAWSWLGIAVIVASGLWVSLRGRTLT